MADCWVSVDLLFGQPLHTPLFYSKRFGSPVEVLVDSWILSGNCAAVLLSEACHIPQVAVEVVLLMLRVKLVTFHSCGGCTIVGVVLLTLRQSLLKEPTQPHDFIWKTRNLTIWMIFEHFEQINTFFNNFINFEGFDNILLILKLFVTFQTKMNIFNKFDRFCYFL